VPNQEESVLLEGVVYKEGDKYVARCFTVDHAAQADTPRTAIQECVEGLLADIAFALKHGTVGYLEGVCFE